MNVDMNNIINADMPIIYSTSNPSDPEVTTFQFQGYSITDSFEQGINLTVPSLIYADLQALSLNPPSGYALWSAYINVPQFDPAITDGFFEYDPPRYRLGNVSHLNRGTVSSSYFLQYETQGFPTQGCLIVPPLYGGIPYDTFDLPVPAQARLLIPVIQSQHPLFGGILNPFGIQRENSGLFGNTDLRVAIYEGVVATVTIAYFGICPINQTPSDTFFFNI